MKKILITLLFVLVGFNCSYASDELVEVTEEKPVKKMSFSKKSNNVKEDNSEVLSKVKNKKNLKQIKAEKFNYNKLVFSNIGSTSDYSTSTAYCNNHPSKGDDVKCKFVQTKITKMTKEEYKIKKKKLSSQLKTNPAKLVDEYRKIFKCNLVKDSEFENMLKHDDVMEKSMQKSVKKFCVTPSAKTLKSAMSAWLKVEKDQCYVSMESHAVNFEHDTKYMWVSENKLKDVNDCSYVIFLVLKKDIDKGIWVSSKKTVYLDSTRSDCRKDSETVFRGDKQISKYCKSVKFGEIGK